MSEIFKLDKNSKPVGEKYKINLQVLLWHGITLKSIKLINKTWTETRANVLFAKIIAFLLLKWRGSILLY